MIRRGSVTEISIISREGDPVRALRRAAGGLARSAIDLYDQGLPREARTALTTAVLLADTALVLADRANDQPIMPEPKGEII